MPRRKSKRKPRLTKAQISYAMMAHVEKRVEALEAQVAALKEDARQRAFVGRLQHALYLAALDEAVSDMKRGG